MHSRQNEWGKMLLHCLHALYASLAASMHPRYFNDDYVLRSPRLFDIYICIAK